MQIKYDHINRLTQHMLFVKYGAMMSWTMGNDFFSSKFASYIEKSLR